MGFNSAFKGLINALIQGVPLPSKSGISLIILNPIKILKRDLNRSTFVVWEMKRNVSVVRLVVVTQQRSASQPASQPACILPDAPLCLSLCHLTYYFLWGCLRGRFYQNKPRTIDALKANITEEIQAVTADVLARNFQNIARRVQSCLDANGGHFQPMLWCHRISYTMR